MKVGFTGTRKGMTLGQVRQLVFLIDRTLAAMTEFHHGAAVGADDQAAAEVMFRRFKVREVPHRPEHHTSEALLARNREIVDAADLLIAAPESDKEELRSGTWATVRYARQKGIPVVMLSRCE